MRSPSTQNNFLTNSIIWFSKILAVSKHVPKIPQSLATSSSGWFTVWAPVRGFHRKGDISLNMFITSLRASELSPASFPCHGWVFELQSLTHSLNWFGQCLLVSESRDVTDVDGKEDQATMAVGWKRGVLEVLLALCPLTTLFCFFWDRITPSSRARTITPWVAQTDLGLNMQSKMPLNARFCCVSLPNSRSIDMLSLAHFICSFLFFFAFIKLYEVCEQHGTQRGNAICLRSYFKMFGNGGSKPVISDIKWVQWTRPL